MPGKVILFREDKFHRNKKIFFSHRASRISAIKQPKKRANALFFAAEHTLLSKEITKRKNEELPAQGSTCPMQDRGKRRHLLAEAAFSGAPASVVPLRFPPSESESCMGQVEPWASLPHFHTNFPSFFHKTTCNTPPYMYNVICSVIFKKKYSIIKREV